MHNDIAIFLDLDNVVIGAEEARLNFDINLILERVKSITNGRIVLRRAYGDWRQRAYLTKELASAGFELHSAVRLNSSSKNLADMQMVVDAMSTLVDRHNFSTYALITGDRDFAPLVQALRKRGKQVLGIGISHTCSKNLVDLCDHYFFYDELESSAQQILDNQMEDLLERALEQLLQEDDRVPASLLKQRMQSLSKGALSRSPQGKRNFRKLLLEYPHIVRTLQEGTTLYVTRPNEGLTDSAETVKNSRTLPDEEVDVLLLRSLTELLGKAPRARASLLKQRMQEISDGAFDEHLQGDKSFRKFLDRHRDTVEVELEGSTLYVRAARLGGRQQPSLDKHSLSTEDVRVLLVDALDDLLVDQPRVRASLLKQHMQEMSGNAFDEKLLGASTFLQFLDRYPALVSVQRKGSTLLVYRSDEEVDVEDLHLLYRSELKKRGLRVIPPDYRLKILRDMVSLLNNEKPAVWRRVVETLYDGYRQNGDSDVSKSYINDMLRLARRAGVLSVGDGGALATAPVSLKLNGGKLFQEAVILCDAAYLNGIAQLDQPFDVEEAALALYESAGYARYLNVVRDRLSSTTRIPY